MTDLEHILRTSLQALARDAGAPAGRATAQEAIDRHRRRRHRRAGLLITAAAVLAVASGMAVADLGSPQREPVAASGESAEQRAPAAGSSSPGSSAPSSPPAPSDTDAPTAGTASACVQPYSPEAVDGRAFAFDGTVTAIVPAISNRPGAELDLSAVTFRVHTWFRGGAGETVTVDMDADPVGMDAGMPFATSAETPPPYEVGTRLLVSGEPRWGGAPLDAAIAWGCGFTRPHDPGTAAAWADATD